MSANLENSAVATGLEKASFHSNPKERQCQRMFKLLHHSNAQNSPSQNTGVGSLYLLQGIFLTRSPTLQADSLPAKPQGKPKNTGVGSLSPADLPDPGIKPRSPALQADSLPTEL